MDPFVIIKALNVAVLVVIGSALFVFWRSADRTPMGTQTSSAWTVTPVNPGGATPTIVTGRPSTRTVRPTASGSAPKRAVHNRCEITASGASSDA